MADFKAYRKREEPKPIKSVRTVVVK